MYVNAKYKKSCDNYIRAFMVLFACILVPFLKISIADDSINEPQLVNDRETLVSKEEKFELSFFLHLQNFFNSCKTFELFKKIRRHHTQKKKNTNIYIYIYIYIYVRFFNFKFHYLYVILNMIF